MRLDHLLSREEVGVGLLSRCRRESPRGAEEETSKEDSGGDALTGHTRSHPEHEG